MPLRDESVDVILCSHVLEHVADDRRAMREMHRVLRPGGWAIVLVPIRKNQQTTFEDPDVVSPEERTRLFGQADPVRRYGRDIKTRLEDAGFAVTPENYTQELSEETRYRHGLKPVHGDYIYLCRPSAAASTLCTVQGFQPQEEA